MSLLDATKRCSTLLEARRGDVTRRKSLLNAARRFLMLHNKYTKEQYMAMRLQDKAKGADLWPSYDEILAAKKVCTPQGVQIISEYEIICPLQSVLDHTTSQIIDNDILLQMQIMAVDGKLRVKLYYKYGGYGSTGQSRY
jgi:hypothetical protein